VIVPIQWDYAAWTPATERLITALKAEKFTSPVSGYVVILTGIASPMTTKALAAKREAQRQRTHQIRPVWRGLASRPRITHPRKDWAIVGRCAKGIRRRYQIALDR
jgi:hypothetical protein